MNVFVSATQNMAICFFLPETGIAGDAFAVNHVIAAAEYSTIGTCGFGASSVIDSKGHLIPEVRKVADTMNIIRMMSPMLLKHGGTDKIFGVTQDEYEQYRYVKREKFHLFSVLLQKMAKLGQKHADTWKNNRSP